MVRNISKQNLRENFLSLGVTVGDALLEKCAELCEAHGLEEEELVDTWMAYSLSHLSGADPTLDTLRQMARASFKAETLPGVGRQLQTSSSPLVIYNAPSAAPATVEDDILSAYDTTPKAKVRPANTVSRTPDSARLPAAASPCTVFSPASFSPTVGNVSAKYLQRTNAGDVVCSYGDTKDQVWRPSGDSRLRPSVQPLGDAPHVPTDVLYMFQQMKAGAGVLDCVVDWLGAQLVGKHALGQLMQLDAVTVDKQWVVGRVCCDGVGRLNHRSVLLEGCLRLSAGATLPCDLHLLPRYSLFPGQVVALQVTSHSEGQLLVHALHSDATLPLPLQLPRLGPQQGDMQVVVAAGPFTQVDTLGYQPLEDLVSYVRSHRPHVLVLIGPFIDCGHPLVLDGSLAQTFQSFFDKLLDGILEPLAEVGTQVVLVPSPRDAHHHAVYPCPPFTLRRQYPGVHLASDPCLLDVHGLVVAATSVDVLLHLGKEEISQPAQSGDRLGRLASHVLAQQSLYPLYPAEESLSVDAELWEQHARLPVTPHLLLLPSDLRFFIKDWLFQELSGCVVVNPERVAKGVVGGSFARLAVSVVDGHVRVAGEIVKI